VSIIGSPPMPLERVTAAADRRAMAKRSRAARPLREDGFALIELLIALTVLTVGILAVASAFTSGTVALRRASRHTTAAALADTQMELYRALTYNAIMLDTTAEAAADSVYKTDPALSGTPSKVLGACAGVPNECNPSRTVVGPDNNRYRIDTYIVYTTPTQGRQVKQVTVVVRDAGNLSGQPLTRIESLFDATTGT
jgi:prepilin-type N-terminal cleavage/methylation domain-containing protein